MDVYARRRAAALGGAALVLLVLVLGVKACGTDVHTGTLAKATELPAVPQLPRGGHTLLPHFRIVAYYGAPQAAALGELGIGTPATAGRKLLAKAALYRPLGRPVLPAMELLASIAANAPGPDGKYRTRQSAEVIDRYLKAARAVHAELILDIQPGYSDFLTETRALEPWLKQPDVSLALDPEWRLNPPVIPGQQIGSVAIEEVNAVSFYLDDLTRRYRLPQKLLLLHRFTPGMIRDQERLKPRAHLAEAINIDGFGANRVKIDKYKAFAATNPKGTFNGFKLFFHEDPDTMTPSQVGRLRPKPDIVVYE